MYDLSQATAFLRELGDGPYVFQTFTDKKELKATFKKNALGKPIDPLARVLIGSFDEHEDTLKSLSERGAGVFVQINEGLKRSLNAITGIRALFVDADKPDTSVETMKSLIDYMPRPSMIVTSSKGKFHVYWRVVDCELDQFKSMQKQLAIQFNTDPHVNNLDRVLRVPGFPHQKKEPVMVTVQAFGGDYATQHLYDCAAKAIPTHHAISAKPRKMTARAMEADAFGLDISDSYQEPVVLAPGNRTPLLVAHIGKMVSDGYSAAAIKAEIIRMNVDLCPADAEPIDESTLEYEVLGCVDKFCDQREQEAQEEKIANAPPPPPPITADTTIESVINKGTKAEEVIYEDISGGENTLDAWIERFRYVDEGSRVIDTKLSGEHSMYSLQDWKNATQNIKVGGKAFLSKKWLECHNRKSVRDTIYYPGKEAIVNLEDSDYWNLYKAAQIVPAPEIDVGKIKPFLAHMEFLFPNDDDRFLFMDWFACTIIHPERRIPWVPLLISDPGAGKGWIYELMVKLVGKQNAIMILPERLTNQFNSFLQNKTLVCIDEMHKDLRGGVVEKLNHIISESHIEINTKGKKEQSEQIFCNVILFSNNEDAAQIRGGDRRFWVHRIDGVLDAKYYHEIWEWQRKGDNLSHILAWCAQRDLTQFAYNKPPPQTKSKADLIENSRSYLEGLIADAIDARDGPFGADITSNVLVTNFVAEHSETPLNNAIKQEVIEVMTRLSNKAYDGQLRTDGKGVRWRHRPRSVRNHKAWIESNPEAIRHELTRSECMLLKKEVAPPQLKEVK